MQPIVLKSSVPPPALTSQLLSVWTGSKGSLYLSVAIHHIDLNNYYTLTTTAPLWELTSAFTSAQAVSLHIQSSAQNPPLNNQHWIPRNSIDNVVIIIFNIMFPFIFLRTPLRKLLSGEMAHTALQSAEDFNSGRAWTVKLDPKLWCTTIRP